MCWLYKIRFRGLCDEYYIVSKYLKAYNSVIHLLPNTNLDPKNNDENLQPSPLKILLRMPRKIREKKKANLLRRRGLQL